MGNARREQKEEDSNMNEVIKRLEAIQSELKSLKDSNKDVWTGIYLGYASCDIHAAIKQQIAIEEGKADSDSELVKDRLAIASNQRPNADREATQDKIIMESWKQPMPKASQPWQTHNNGN
jgi:hypothetical protein